MPTSPSAKETKEGFLGCGVIVLVVAFLVAIASGGDDAPPTHPDPKDVAAAAGVIDSARALLLDDADRWSTLRDAREMLEDLDADELAPHQVGAWRSLLSQVDSLEGVRRERQKAPVTRAGSPACQSPELYDQLAAVAAQKDERGFAYLLDGNGCVLLRGGLPVSVLDRTFGGRVQMRVYGEGKAAVLWASYKAVDDGR